MKSSHRPIREGFSGQRMAVLPPPVVRSALQAGPASDLLPTDIGYFPDAEWHGVERADGANQLIVIYCVRGVGWAEVNGKRSDITPGTVLILPRKLPHAYGTGGRDAWTIYWFHLAGSKVGALEQILTPGASAAAFLIGEDPELLSLFEETYELLHHGYGPEQLLIASLTIGRLVGRLIGLERSAATEHSPRQRIARTVDFMKRRQTRRVTIPELARLANMSCSHYAMKFKQQIGFPPLDYFIRLKMRTACHLLDTTQLPIKQIASEVGINDALYFSRKFHQIHDMSPTQYRSLKKG